MVTMLSRVVTKAGVGAKKKDYGHKLSSDCSTLMVYYAIQNHLIIVQGTYPMSACVNVYGR